VPSVYITPAPITRLSSASMRQAYFPVGGIALCEEILLLVKDYFPRLHIEIKMMEKLFNSPKAFLLIVFTISVIFPISGGVLQAISCPSQQGLAYFPFVSANCFGEFLGDVGLFCFGLPGLILSYIAISLVAAIIESFHQISPNYQLVAIAVVALLLNFTIFFYSLRFFLFLVYGKRYPKEKT
jgi:hypothetical protein